ncbi:hypothetical protein EJ06DRAFT_526055 [Trichodelitschia bisporula]|uniref:Pre-mRNA-processing factor 39 n=1 Tax=Trichodelitschia bisporula TaxID=703511 RepID=A0A6G1IBP4_9PEZI|nr:hypothetical protein EJ06DRAFT_526055 [Trichodelitschia bisporula]
MAAADFVPPVEIPWREVPDLSQLDDAEYAELKKLNAEVAANPDEYEPWNALINAIEGLENGLTRNSSPQAISAMREVYDRMLAKFPLFFVFWKRYADLEFFIAGTEAAEMVYERGVACIRNSVDLWTSYCDFKVKTCHDPEVNRELFERGADSVGLDYHSHPFWDKYLEYEERLEAPEKIYAVLSRIVQIPMQKYREYFDRFRIAASYRPVSDLLPAETLVQLRNDSLLENPTKSEFEIEREARARIDLMHVEIYNHTQTEALKRASYEDQIKRPYFHVTELPEAELENWRVYLNAEEAEGDYARITFLYERCMVVCALYEEFWMRYARWMEAQPGKTEEVRNICVRASCVFLPIFRPNLRLQYALFEEQCGRPDVARDVYQGILLRLPGHLQTITALAGLERRQHGMEAAIAVFNDYIKSPGCDNFTKGTLVSQWATMLWKIKGSAEEARDVYQRNTQYYLDSRPFWVGYLQFELDQPTSAATESVQYERIKGVFDEICRSARIGAAAIRDLAHLYMEYLMERGPKDAAKECLRVDKEINGPNSVRSGLKGRMSEYKSVALSRGLYDDNQAESEISLSALRLGMSVHDRYFRELDDTPTGSNGQSIPYRYAA